MTRITSHAYHEVISARSGITYHRDDSTSDTPTNGFVGRVLTYETCKQCHHYAQKEERTIVGITRRRLYERVKVGLSHACVPLRYMRNMHSIKMLRYKRSCVCIQTIHSSRQPILARIIMQLTTPNFPFHRPRLSRIAAASAIPIPSRFLALLWNG